jgi:hypothetical protein
MRSGEVTSMSADVASASAGLNPVSAIFNRMGWARRQSSTLGSMRLNPLDNQAAATKTEAWFRCWFDYETLPVSSMTVINVNWVGGGAHESVRVRFSSDAKLHFQVWDNVSTYVDVVATSALVVGTKYLIEFHYQTSQVVTTDSWTWDIFVDSVQLGTTFTGSWGGNTFTGAGFNIISYGDNSVEPTCFWNLAEICIDSNTRIGSTRTTKIPLTGFGAHNDWTVDASRDYRAMLDMPYSTQSSSPPGTLAASSSGAVQTFTLATFASLGITGTLNSIRVGMYQTNGSATSMVIRRNGVDTVYAPAVVGANYNSVLVDCTGWSTSDTIEVGVQTTSATTQRISGLIAIVEHDTAGDAVPTGVIRVLNTTYVGTGDYNTIDLSAVDIAVADQEPSFMVISRLDSVGSAGQIWWDSQPASRSHWSDSNSVTTIIAFRGGFHISSALANINEVGITYAVVAVFDPSQRMLYRDGRPYPTSSDDHTANFRSGFGTLTPELVLAQNGVYGSTSFTAAFFRGPGQSGDQACDLISTTGAFASDAIQDVSAGSIQFGGLLSYPAWGCDFVGFNTSGVFTTTHLMAIGTYTGDGTGARVITDTLSALTPTCVILGHNDARQRNIWIGGVCRRFDTAQLDATAITAVGANTFTVHANLNTTGKIYTYLMLAGGHDDPPVPPLPPPVQTGIAPPTAYVVGGEAVVITGTDFVTGCTVTIGGVPCTNVVFVNSTRITCNVPVGMAVGTYAVAVTNPDAQVCSTPLVFTFVPNPVTTGQWNVKRVDLKARVEQES